MVVTKEQTHILLDRPTPMLSSCWLWRFWRQQVTFWWELASIGRFIFTLNNFFSILWMQFWCCSPLLYLHSIWGWENQPPEWHSNIMFLILVGCRRINKSVFVTGWKQKRETIILVLNGRGKFFFNLISFKSYINSQNFTWF